MLVALGANLPRGDSPPESTLAHALHALSESPGLSLTARSPFYRTPAVPAGSGPDFVNAAAAIEPALAPAALLERLHAIEADLGRTRPGRWAPRACDLDLLAAGARVLPDRRTAARWMALSPGAARRARPRSLILPHPRMHERAFVLVPLAEIAPDWRHPLTQRTVREMRDRLPAVERDPVVPLGQA